MEPQWYPPALHQPLFPVHFPLLPRPTQTSDGMFLCVYLNCPSSLPFLIASIFFYSVLHNTFPLKELDTCAVCFCSLCTKNRQ